MRLHLVDGTYELFRMYFGAPKSTSPTGKEVGATRALLSSLLALVQKEGATHVGVAFDTVVESFRNALFDGYKTGEGLDPLLFAQFPLAERAARALGLRTWSMIEHECDDALATAVGRFVDHPEVDNIVICSPDKDLCQCVRGERVVLYDRRQKVTYDEAGVREKFGIFPTSIPDYLALVGDAADGIPGIPRWGAKSAGQVLAHYGHLEAIPDDGEAWEIKVRGAKALAQSLAKHREQAQLYRKLATLREDSPLDEEEPAQLAWRGAEREALTLLCEELGETRLLSRVEHWA
ncbi:MAG: flap endonuclease [Deltaproteobacteria bacterium]|nr:flap endonuclease [Deltaproteobacteria bacterium]